MVRGCDVQGDVNTKRRESDCIRIALSTITKKIRFVTLDPPRDSDKLRILLQGFVSETGVSDMKIVHEIGSERC